MEATRIVTKTTLQLQYKPVDLFEIPFEYFDKDYTITLNNGVAEVILSKPVARMLENLQFEIIDKVRAILQGQMISKHENFELGSMTIQNEYEDGNITTSQTIQGQASIIHLKSYPPDIILKDSSGKIIRDTKAERLSEEKALINLIANTSNKRPLLNKILDSYKSAVSDPADELVHLYEIIDALKTHYRKKEEALKQLGLSEANWDRLFSLSNNEPLKEGRHRGSKQNLRHANDDELEEARNIAREMIKAAFSKLG